MNNEEFKLGIKTTITITLIIIGIIIGVLIYVFSSRNTEADIYAEILSNTTKDLNSTSVSEISLETKGIDKEEFESYLKLFGHLVKEYPELVEKEEKHTLMLDAAVELLNTMYTYEENNVNENLVLEADKINKIVREMNGEYINKKLNVKNRYKYDEEKNEYIVQANDFNECLLIETLNIVKEDEKIEAEFKVAFPDEKSFSDYTNNLPVEMQTYTVKAVILENSEYEYSKYYVSNIDVIKKETVSYN